MDRVCRVEISSRMASRHVRDVPPRPRTFYSSVFHRISYSRHEVTYLSGRKRFRGCTVVVKNSNVTLPERKMDRTSLEYSQALPCSILRKYFVILIYVELRNFLRVVLGLNIIFCFCRLIKRVYVK